MIKVFLIPVFCWICLNPGSPVAEDADYSHYHRKVIEAEELIAAEQYAEALSSFEELFKRYHFVFRRDYLVAAQLACYLEEPEKTAHFLREGIKAGWTLKSIRKNNYLDSFKKTESWKRISKDYQKLNSQYEASLDQELRKEVKKMFSRDQWKAIGALLKFSDKARDRYSEKKFAPHSERQMTQVMKILEEHGYPGEKLIGNDFWMSTIISHHNSISQNYVVKDSLYPSLQNDLQHSLKKGQLSPYEYALIDEWYRTVKSGWEEPIGYGILNTPSEQSLASYNSLREKCLLRPVELRNKLVDIQEKTGMDFYLPGGPWIDGKIEIRQETP